MLEPNIPLLRRFVQLEEVTTVVERSEMATKRLDDLLTEIPGGGVEPWLIRDSDWTQTPMVMRLGRHVFVGPRII